MAVVEKSLSPKPVTSDNLLDTMNREIVPVLKTARDGINRWLVSYSVTVGDGVATVFAIPHPLGTKDVFVQLKDVATDTIINDPTYTAVTTDDSTVTVTAPAPPAVDGLRVSVRA